MHASYDKSYVRAILPHELKRALNLVWTVFQEYEAPDYSPQGIQTFKEFIHYPSFQERLTSENLTVYGYFDHTELIGVLALRNRSHISLLFVHRAFHHRGVARSLVQYWFNHCRAFFPTVREITVNSSPYAVGFYHKLGFADTSAEQTVNGIRFTPMKYKF